MKLFRDFEGRPIRLTDERLKHILDHPEMVGIIDAVPETLAHPEEVIQSLSDPEAYLYCRWYADTLVGDKYLCVIVKRRHVDSFVLTAYLTDAVKKGKRIWGRK